MIVFVPAYDPSTEANIAIAKLIITEDCVTFFEKKATRQELIAVLSKANLLPVFAMCHGVRNALKGHKGEVALSCDNIHDLQLLSQRTVYAFACHTATELGRSAADIGAIWWGYSDTISCAIDSSSVIPIFTEIFIFIRDNFQRATSSQDRQRVIEQLKQMCEQAEAQVDQIDAQTEITDITEVYMTLRHIWDRLRIWVPGIQVPEQHPDASSPSLPWG
ncbi:hypothetical protein [Coleofasciculus chthonoplastes]|uniref:hypothetical protein n=1 Tax=Coleofasciculus chthonoplastes TaxID=64178 RepID=UPI0032F4438B